MNTNTDQKETRSPRKEKRAPRTPAGYECRGCGFRYAPGEAHPTKPGLCFDCDKETN